MLFLHSLPGRLGNRSLLHFTQVVAGREPPGGNGRSPVRIRFSKSLFPCNAIGPNKILLYFTEVLRISDWRQHFRAWMKRKKLPELLWQKSWKLPIVEGPTFQRIHFISRALTRGNTFPHTAQPVSFTHTTKTTFDTAVMILVDNVMRRLKKLLASQSLAKSQTFVESKTVIG